MAKKGLGKGLGAIFGEDVNSREEEEHKIRESARKKGTSDPGNTAQEDGTAGEQMVKVALIEPNQSQPRKKFDQEQMEELAESIKLHGVLQPLLVQKKDGLYEIIAGERRWRAAKLAGLKEVPVVIRQYTPQESMEVALIENLQREDLNPIEEAKAYQKLIQEFGLKQEEIAAKVAKNRTTITNAMRLLKLDEGIQNMVIENVISSGHARALLGLEDPEMQLKAAKMIMEDKLSVRETERLVKRLIREAEEKDKPKKQEKNINFIYQNLEERMKTVMGTKVTIHNKDKNKGRIEIEYYSEAELERIVEMIESIR